MKNLSVFSFSNNTVNTNTSIDFRLIPAKSHVTLQLHVKECAGVNFLEHVQVSVKCNVFLNVKLKNEA
jgi:hypothetical protein